MLTAWDSGLARPGVTWWHCYFAAFCCQDVWQIIVRRESLLGQFIDGLIDGDSYYALAFVYPGVGAQDVVLAGVHVQELSVGFHLDARLGWNLLLALLGCSWV